MNPRKSVTLMFFLLIMSFWSSRSIEKIAFLFLLKYDLPFELVWYEFFHWKVPPGEPAYSIYLHTPYKFPKTSFFSGKEMSNPIATRWGDISLVKAIQLLLKEALNDQENQIFCLISDSCIPLQPFPVFQLLLSQKKSVIRACKGTHGFGSDNINRWRPDIHFKHSNISKQHWRKSEMYFALIRKHAILLSSLNLKGWEKVFAPDEHTFPSLLAAHNLENETTCSKGFTSVSWTLKDIKHPRTFKIIDLNAQLFTKLKASDQENSPCSDIPGICHFTARKFSPKTLYLIIDRYISIILSSEHPTLSETIQYRSPSFNLYQYAFRDYCADQFHSNHFINISFRSVNASSPKQSDRFNILSLSEIQQRLNWYDDLNQLVDQNKLMELLSLYISTCNMSKKG